MMMTSLARAAGVHFFCIFIITTLTACNLQFLQRAERAPIETPSRPAAKPVPVPQTAAAHMETIDPDMAEPALPLPHRLEPAAGLTDLDDTPAPAQETQTELTETEALAWDHMRAGFALPQAEHPRLQRQIDWYQSNPHYLDRVFERGDPFLAWIMEKLAEQNMPTELALLPVVESGFQPFAYSHGRAAGLWQFIPGTGKRFGLKQNWWYDGRRDVVASTTAALQYLDYLHNYFDGDWLLALAAYNSGEGTVSNAVRRNKALGKPTDFWHLDLPKETRDYVPKLLALRDVIAEPERYGIELRPIEAEAQVTEVDIQGQLDMALAAELAGMEIDTLYRLNPGFNRWATDPDGPHRLLMPNQHVDEFLANLAALPEDERVNWERHQVQPGDSLSSIAKRYHTSVALLRSSNSLKTNQIRAGQYLLIPVARRELNSYVFSAPQREQQRLAAKTQRGAQIYTVKAGDTLWEVARAHNMSVMKLARMNGMAPGDALRIGRQLAVDEPVINSTQSLLPRSATRQTVHYTVRRGDSLSRISQRFQVSVANVRKWNRLKVDQYLQPGQRLTLYVDVTAQAVGG